MMENPSSTPSIVSTSQSDPGSRGDENLTTVTGKTAIDLSIVVPTFNESANVAPLIALLEKALAGVEWEVVFVDDDSPDHTAEVVAQIAQQNRRVRKLHRIGRRGLSSACIEGILSSSAPFVAVMDGDLQHDESVLKTMLARARDESADLVVGTRYATGEFTGEWNDTRLKMSRFATTLSKIFVGAPLSDPMSGFFLIRRTAFDGVVRGLSGLGFKILLDIVATNPKGLKIIETPFTFRERQSGESKLDSLVLWEFAMLLLDKKFGKLIPVRFLTFAMIGAIGVAVHLLVLAGLFEALKVEFIWAQGVAATAAMISNYALNNVVTYRDRRKKGLGWWTGLISFMAVCSVGAFANVGIANYMYAGHTNWAVAALLGILVGAVWNYAVTSAYTWKK